MVVVQTLPERSVASPEGGGRHYYVNSQRWDVDPPAAMHGDLGWTKDNLTEMVVVPGKGQTPPAEPKIDAAKLAFMSEFVLNCIRKGHDMTEVGLYVSLAHTAWNHIAKECTVE